jgi:hypothetical protein
VVIRRFRRKESGIGSSPTAAELLDIMRPPLGQHCPMQKPKAPEAPVREPAATGADARLGQPLDIRQVARLLGCSPWSVRNAWIPKGLPHFRCFGASSKLIFYEAQVVRWVERQQAKGG